jgi:hypothetical protein
VRQIQQRNPQFQLQIMKSPNSTYNQNTVRYLELTLEAQLAREAEGKAPRVGMENHHICSMCLGGPRSGPTVPLDPVYHQLITNAVRNQFGYPAPRGLNEQVREQELIQIYQQYPLP